MGDAPHLTQDMKESPRTLAFPIEATASRPSGDKHSVVLVADPNEAVRDSLGGLLTNWGYRVVCARNGWEALQVLSAESGPSLAILDWTMTGLDGPEVCRRVRAQNHARYVFMILATVRGQVQDLMSGLGAGADDYVAKPFDAVEVRARLDAGSRILVQKALRESEERFHSAFECAGVGMALVHESGRWLQVNQTLCEFLGYTQQELQATTFQAITHPDDLARALRSRQGMMSGALKTFHTEKRYIHKSGHPVWASLTVSPVRDAEGRIACLVAQVQDIGKRKVAEEALRRSEALFRAIAENAGDVIVVLNPHDAEIRYASRATAEVLGYLPAELEGHCAFDYVHPGDQSRAAEALRYTAETGKSRVTEVRVGHKSGRWRTLDSHAGAIRNDRREVDGVVVVLRVIEDRIHAEEALRTAHAESELFINSVPSILIGTDTSGGITRWNQTAALTFGLSEAAVRGKPLQECGVHWLDFGTGVASDSWLLGEGSRRVENIPFRETVSGTF